MYQFLSNWPWVDENLPLRAANGQIDCLSDYESSKVALDRIIVTNGTKSKHLRILCYILTVSKYHASRCRAVQATWGPRCDRLVFASDEDDELLGAVRIPNALHDYDHLWDKHRKTLKFLYEKYSSDYDWFVKADDDTFLIVENLKHFLASPMISAVTDTEPLHLGHRLVLPDYQLSEINVPALLLNQFAAEIGRWIYNSGGAGYAMNKVYIERFMRAYDKPTCLPRNRKVPEDAGLAFCMAFEGIFPTYSRDKRDMERFHLQNPSNTYRGLPRWVSRYHEGLGGPLSGPFSISPETIGFHYITPALMEFMDAQLYSCRGAFQPYY